ncbi:hypothetical protein CC1G_14502 [Coprinopsis cinerea okayama7|uniref:Uncharacterized protein n=1 Tax=Coprinopsis cinerea (strain Okayama-7 / 130 / ATCC MYA-4618 / FGSC 9003) TaxID=240176 RepID=D6RLW2_COPC7|nr:hypothetical protein CC1G_14502 [Coprinopsis cinerea okayama7\|eukprot:XP_002911504.1 hypothetical protein CC1G_14502 [Coprinopsis cinerea okayama7\
MAILKCERPNCGETQGLHQGRPIVRDAQGRITRENGWTFDPTTGRCTADDSDYSGRSQPYFRTCFGCFTKSMWVYSSEPPPLPPPTYAGPSHEERALAGEDDEEEYVWSKEKPALSSVGVVDETQKRENVAVRTPLLDTSTLLPRRSAPVDQATELSTVAVASTATVLAHSVDAQCWESDAPKSAGVRGTVPTDLVKGENRHYSC